MSMRLFVRVEDNVSSRKGYVLTMVSLYRSLLRCHPTNAWNNSVLKFVFVSGFWLISNRSSSAPGGHDNGPPSSANLGLYFHVDGKLSSSTSDEPA